MSRTFLDTNVFVYADDLSAGSKARRAQELIQSSYESGTAVLSTQVLQEYFVVATRKLGVDAARARRRLELMASADVVQVREDLILGAIDLHRLNRLSFWDALIVQCAAAAGCSRVLTEDLQHGQVVAGVRVEDPFG